MESIAKLWKRVLILSRRSRFEREMEEEIRLHLEMKTEENLASGMSPQEARSVALRRFGNQTLMHEQSREVWTFRWLYDLVHDLRFALRSFRASPGFAAVSVVTLALGIGANTAIFTVVNAALLRPLPYRDSGRLVMVWNQLLNLGLTRFGASYDEYFDYRDQNRVFESIAAFGSQQFDLTGSAQPERVSGVRVSANLLPILGASAALGRTFTGDENQAGRDTVTLLSDALWRRRFGADPSLIGKTISLDGSPHTVVGIVPRGFRFSTDGSDSPDVWVPIAFHPDPGGQTGGTLRLIARLKPGITLERAQAEMSTIAARLEQQSHLYRGPHGEDAGYAVQVVPLREEIFGAMRQGLLVLLGAVGFVLLIACANVANLLLARAAARQKEMAIRAALGAGRLRVMRQLLTESLMLAVLGGAAGLLVARWGLRLLLAASPAQAARLGAVAPVVPLVLDSRVLAFTLLITVLTGLLFGLAPAFESAQFNLNESLKEGGRTSAAGADGNTRRRFSRRAGLVVAQVALSMVLVLGAALLIRSFVRLLEVDPGFNPEKLVTAEITLPEFQYREDYQVSAFFDQFLDRVRALPEVKSAGAVSGLPLNGRTGGDPFSIEGRPWRPTAPGTTTPQFMDHETVAAGYFRTLQIPLLAGREFTEQDAAGSLPVAVINQTMARAFWPHQDPIGKHIMPGAPRPGAAWLTIVGVVGDVKSAALDVASIPQMYRPLSQHPVRTMALVIRTSADPMSVISEVRRQLFALDKDRPLYHVAAMEQIVSDSVAPRRFDLLLLGVFAALALALAAVGIYGVMSYSVAQRTHEIGVRLALGARRGDVLRLVARQGLTLALAGIAIGLVASLALTRLISGLLFSVRATDPITFAGVSLLFACVALVASFIPAHRATRVDPIVALRHE
ncbi:MAG: ADOP family duplicated permease [Terriglobia bacterium]